ncbi:DUF1648 domain-containing protein [bacterium]|nr:DUF1648 domain-containing protein [bacterium]
MNRLLPWLALIFSAAVLVVLYPYFPERWPIHWGADGQANGWAGKHPIGAAFPLLFAFVFTLVLEAAGWLHFKFRNSRLSPEWSERMALANQKCLRGMSLMINLFFGYLACRLPFGPPHPLSIVLLVLVAVAYPVYSFTRLTREMSRKGELPAGYRGLTYNDPDDPRIWVPKLGGYGWTLNFAHTRARLIMLALVAFPLVLVLATVLLKHP